MKKSQRKYAVVAVGIIAILAFTVLMPGLETDSAYAELENRSDTGFAASIKFENGDIPSASITSTSGGYPSADALGGSFSIFPRLSVLDSAGKDVTNTNLVIGVKGKLVTAGNPVANWNIAGTMKILVDDKEFKTVAISASGTGNPPDPVSVKLDGGDSVSYSMAALKQFWGPTNYGQRNILLVADVTVVVNFTDGTAVTNKLAVAEIGTVSLDNQSNTISTFALESNYSTTGTTSEPDPGSTTTVATKVTDNWNSGDKYDYPLDRSQVRVGMKIFDVARYNADLTAIEFRTDRAGSMSGTIVAKLIRLSDNAVIATSTTSYNAGSISTSDKTLKFEFAPGTRTPSGEFWIGMECVSCSGSGEIQVNYGARSTSAYKNGNPMVMSSNGSWSNGSYDLTGMASYTVYK